MNSVKGTVHEVVLRELEAQARLALLRLLHEVDRARVAVRDLARLGEDEPEQGDRVALGGQPHADGVELAQLHPRALGLRGEAEVLEGLLERGGEDERRHRLRQVGVPGGGPAARAAVRADQPDHRHEARPRQRGADGVAGESALEVHHEHLGIVGAAAQRVDLGERVRLELRGQRLGPAPRRGRAVRKPDELAIAWRESMGWPRWESRFRGRACLPPRGPRYNPATIHDDARFDGTSAARRDAGGGLLPGTLTVVYGATGIGKTHLGLTYASHGRVADGRPGILFDMNVRGDSQQHHAYAERLFGWPLRRWTHTVTPMADPYPPPGELDAYYCDAFPWVGKLREYQLPSPDGFEFDWNWKAAYNPRSTRCGRSCTSISARARGASWWTASSRWTCPPTTSSRTSSTSSTGRPSTATPRRWAWRSACRCGSTARTSTRTSTTTPAVTTLLLVTTEETQLEHLLARKVASGDIGAVANTILVMGSERVGPRLARYLAVVKHRGSAMSDEFAEYRVTEHGLQFV